MLGAKAFYFWINKYHARRDSEQQLHSERLKQIAFENLAKARHQASQKTKKVQSYY